MCSRWPCNGWPDFAKSKTTSIIRYKIFVLLSCCFSNPAAIYPTVNLLECILESEHKTGQIACGRCLDRALLAFFPSLTLSPICCKCWINFPCITRAHYFVSKYMTKKQYILLVTGEYSNQL